MNLISRGRLRVHSYGFNFGCRDNDGGGTMPKISRGRIPLTNQSTWGEGHGHAFGGTLGYSGWLNAYTFGYFVHSETLTAGTSFYYEYPNYKPKS